MKKVKIECSVRDMISVLRHLIPLKINGYILKATISVDEVSQILEETKKYLLRSGRVCGEPQKKEDFLEERLKRYLTGQGTEPL